MTRALVAAMAASTSWRLAMLDAAELGPTFGVVPERYLARLAGGPAAFLKAVEGAEDDRASGESAAADLRPEDMAFGIAASGRTPWVVGALDTAGALLILVPRWTSIGAIIITCTVGLGTFLCFTRALYNPSFPMVMTLLAATLVWLAWRPKLA